MTTDEKGVLIQIQNTIVSSKALVSVNCLNTFVHDCGWKNSWKGKYQEKKTCKEEGKEKIHAEGKVVLQSLFNM